MKVINLLGGPGCGKSTTAAGLFYKMKLQHGSVELVTEVAKDLVYDNRLDFLAQRQEWVLAEQHLRLKRLEGHVDYAIVDSPLLLSLVYPNEEWSVYDSFTKFALEIYNTFDNIVIYLERPDTYQQYGRREDAEAAVLVDEKVKKVMKGCVIDYHIVKTDGENTVDSILTLLRKYGHETERPNQER